MGLTARTKGFFSYLQTSMVSSLTCQSQEIMIRPLDWYAESLLTCINNLQCVVLLNFQSNEREIDIGMARELYRPDMYLLNDYLFHTGSYDLHIIQGIPEKTVNYATIFKPFDGFTWTLIGSSVVAVIVAFVVIEKISNQWTKLSTKDLVYLSKVYS